MVIVRRVEAGEGEQLRAIRLAALQADPTAFARTYEEEVTLGPDYWDMRAAGGPTSQLFVAVDAGRFVGLVGGYEPAAGEPVELVSMWIAPAGRRQGVGRRLVDAVIEWAADLGPPSVDLWVTRGNDSALALYESCDFAVIDEVRPAPNDPCREEIRMRRVLSSDDLTRAGN